MSKSTTIAISLAALGAVACGPGPVKTATIPDERDTHPVAERIEEHKVVTAGPDAASVDQVRALNQQAGTPRFGFIGAYYQLPVANPAGAALVSGNIVGIPYEQVRIEPDASRPWAVVPAPTAETEMLQSTLNSLLDAGVVWTEVSMADATKIMQAEQQAAGADSLASFNKLTPSGVDLLVSLQQGRGVTGPLYVGRVVRTSDGALLAIATQHNAGPMSLKPLVWKLVQQSLERMVARGEG